MANAQVDTIGFRRENYPDVLEIANRLAELEQRKPHDSIRILILEAGQAKIEKLEYIQRLDKTEQMIKSGASMPADSGSDVHNSPKSTKTEQESQEKLPKLTG